MTTLETTTNQDGHSIPTITTTLGDILDAWSLMRADTNAGNTPADREVQIHGVPFGTPRVEDWNWSMTLMDPIGFGPVDDLVLVGDLGSPTTDAILSLLPDLDVLVDFINDHDNILGGSRGDSLPTWGTAPHETLGIYSWDETRVMFLEGEASTAPRWPYDHPNAEDMDDDEIMGIVRSYDAEGNTEAVQWALGLVENDDLRQAYNARS